MVSGAFFRANFARVFRCLALTGVGGGEWSDMRKDVKHQHHTHPSTPKRKWWQWVALGLMLLAIGMYVLSLDDSVIPEAGVRSGGTPPAASAGPGK